MLDKGIEEFVRTLAGETKHSGRTFFEHLKGTHDLLEQNGAPPHVCLAGLCHSIYGTNAFKHASVSLQERGRIAGIIGDEAEMLAYIFCSCDRPLAFIIAANFDPPYWVIDRRIWQRIELMPSMLRDLLQIEQANLQEQGSMEMLPRVADALRKVKDE